MRTSSIGARGALSIMASLALTVWLVGCGSDPVTPPPPPTTTLPPCTQTPVFTGAGGVPSGFLDAETFTTAAGRLDVTVDWTFASSTIGVYLVPTNSCSLALFNARTCNFLIRSESGAKPRRVSAANVAAGTYDLLVANFASQDESLSAQVVLSSASCPAISAAPSSVGAEGGATLRIATRRLLSR